MIKLKVGMKVKRIKGSWGGMKVGDIGTIKELNGTDGAYLKEFNPGHNHSIKNLTPILSWKDRFKNV